MFTRCLRCGILIVLNHAMGTIASTINLKPSLLRILSSNIFAILPL